MFVFFNLLGVASCLFSYMLPLLQLCSISCSCSASVLTAELLQVYCLKSIRAIEAGDKIDPRFENYEPTDPEMKALLARDPGAHKHPYKSAVEDALIITMKGISAAMQNTG
jgi:phosphoenolpyruvate carboxylase